VDLLECTGTPHGAFETKQYHESKKMARMANQWHSRQAIGVGTRGLPVMDQSETVFDFGQHPDANRNLGSAGNSAPNQSNIIYVKYDRSLYISFS
jgi:hypothetical protein